MDLPNRDNSATKKVVVDNNSKIRIYLDKMVVRKLSTLFPVFTQGVHPDSIHLYLDSRRPIYYEHEHGWITFFIEVNPEDLKKIISK